jgi:hypothetical protein
MADVKATLLKSQQLSSAAQQDILTRAPEHMYAPTIAAPVAAPQANAVAAASRVVSSRSSTPRIDVNKIYNAISPVALKRNAVDFGTGSRYQAKYGPTFVPEPTKPPTPTGALATALGVLQSKPITAIASALGFAGNAAYAGASFLLNPLASAASAGVQKLSGDNQSFSDLFNQNFETGLSTTQKFFEGQRPGEQILNQLTPDAMKNPYLYFGVTVADALLDPTNRLSFASKGIEVANEAGKVVQLSKEGTAAYKVALNAATKGLEAGSMEFRLAEQKVATQFVKEAPGTLHAASAGARLASNDIKIGNFTLKGGEIKIPGGPLLSRGTDVAKQAVVNVMHNIPGFDKAAEVMKNAFVSATDRIGNQVATDIASRSKQFVGSELSKNDALIANLTKGLSKEDSLLIATARQGIEEGTVKLSSPAALEKAQQIFKAMDDRIPLEQAAKIPVEAIPHYMPQLYKEGYDVITQKLTDAKIRLFKMVKNNQKLNPIQQELLAMFKSDAGDLKRIAGQPYFVNDKFLRNAAMAQEVGLTPVQDLKQILKSRLDSSVNAIAKNNLATELDQTFGAKAIAQYQTYQGKIEAIRNAIKGGSKDRFEKFVARSDVQRALRKGDSTLVDNFITKLGSNAKSILDEARANLDSKIYGDIPLVTRTMEVNGERTAVRIPQETSDLIDKTLGAVAKDGESIAIPDWLKGPLKVYDGTTKAFKTAVTTYFPKFYIRNLMDSTFRNVQDLGLFNVLRPTVWQDSMKMALMSDARALTKWGEETITYGGREYKLSELRKIMDQYGVTQTLRSAEGISKPFRKGGDAVENFSRVQNFLMNLEKSGSPSQAAKSSLKFQYDYGNLTKFERGVMQRIFPFYTFRSRNLAFQVGEIFKNPAPYMTLAQLRSAAERRLGVANNDGSVPDYITSGYAIPLYKDEKGNTKFLGGSGLSFEDADSLLSSVTSPRRFEQNLGSSLNPALRIATEAALKRNMFVGANYSDSGASNGKYQQAALSIMQQVSPNFTQLEKGTYTSKAGAKSDFISANPLAISLASSLPSSRFTSVASDFMRDDKSIGEAIAGQFAPAKIYTVSPDYAEQNKKRQEYTANDVSLQKLYQEGILSRGKDGGYYVNTRYSTGDPVKDSLLRSKARDLLAQ